MGSYVIIKNRFTDIESPLPLETWDKLGAAAKKAFIEVDRIIEPPEVTELKKRQARAKN